MCNCTSEVWSFGPSRNDEELVRHQNYFPKPARDRKETMSTQQLFLGIISGRRRRSHAEVADRAARIAGGFERLGVRQGDNVCILMRNDIAFIEAAYSAMMLSAYSVPVNWHFKPEGINYGPKDSRTSVLVSH